MYTDVHTEHLFNQQMAAEGWHILPWWTTQPNDTMEEHTSD